MRGRLRHSRSEQFGRWVSATDLPAPGGRWTDVASDPNAPAAVTRRAETLRACWRPPVSDRLAFLEGRCRGRRVLDVGCVAHDVRRMDSRAWLHGRLAGVAERCIGVDVVADGVEEMRRRGFTAVLHDLSTGLGPIEGDAPFDVIVAGELIEHVASIDMLFRVARAGLAPDGELILTTPNPYAPHRVRAGQLGVAWENVDHIVYAFPSGIAELAERHGLLLTEAAVTAEETVRRPSRRVRQLLRWARGRRWLTVGFATVGTRRVQRVVYGGAGRLLRGMVRPRRQFVGETFIYVIRRPAYP
jgi:2-polyprenyl-3-methyl-5-hydroxy-6-metoxy-1,4-benzoquinol methylase